MKKLLTLSAVLLALFAFAPTKAEAGHRAKRVGNCQHCHQPIYSYYRPIHYGNGYVRYSWVTSYHNSCQTRYARRSYAPQVHSYYGRAYRPTYRSYYGGPSISLRFGGFGGHYHGGYRGGHCR